MKPNIPIPGLEDYHITKHGNLFSIKSGEWKELKGCINCRWGRKQFKIRKKWYKASRLVALVYVKNPNPEKYNVVCHKDNNPRYGISLPDEVKKKISKANSGYNNGNFKCNEKLVREIFRLRKIGFGQSQIAKKLTISSHTVNKTLRGKNILGMVSNEYKIKEKV